MRNSVGKRPYGSTSLISENSRGDVKLPLIGQKRGNYRVVKLNIPEGILGDFLKTAQKEHLDFTHWAISVMARFVEGEFIWIPPDRRGKLIIKEMPSY